jgi:hypothetical protein
VFDPADPPVTRRLAPRGGEEGQLRTGQAMDAPVKQKA